MKSERRHELQTNALADWLAETIERIKPYQNAIIGLTVVVAIAILAGVIWHHRAEAQAAEAWEGFRAPLMPKNPAELGQIAQKYAGSPAGDWAKVLSGDEYLAAGEGAVFSDKKQGDQYLGQAETLYQAALKDSELPQVRERAMFGVARAQEAQGKLADAKKTYEELNKAFPEGMFKDVVKERLTAIDSEDMKRFYDDFKSFDPKAMAAKEKEKAAAKENEKAAASPRQAREALALPSENPPEEPAKKAPSKVEPAKPEVPKAEAPKPETPKSEAPKTDAPKAETPKSEAPKADAPKPEAPKAEAPNADTAKPEAPKADAPKK